MAVPTQLAFRTQKSIQIIDAAQIYEPLPGFERPEGNIRCSAYSPCGRYFAWASPEKVTVINATAGHVISSLNAQNVYELGFSPLGAYIITWQRPSKDEHGDAAKNLKVWRVVEANGSEENDEHIIVGTFVQKSQTGWNLQYTSDEKYCARIVTNEVQLYESGDLGKVWNRLRVEGVSDFALSPGQLQSIAVYVPERKGQPAAAKVFNASNLEAVISQKSFFKCDKVTLKWNKQGTSLLVLAETEVDKSGKSYMGESTLYLLSANGSFDARIDLDKEGPILDVTWSPTSKEFCVVYGYVPMKTTVFNTRAQATHSFVLAPRNTVMYSPNGRFLIVAGWGVLNGQVDIYDLEKDFHKVCTIQAPDTTICEWSPDCKHILMATTSPRLRVHNGVRIWHVGGGLMYKEDHEELYHVTWRPQPTNPGEDPFHPLPTPHASALAYLSTVKTPSKPVGAYRPPGARGTTTPLAFMREDQGGTAYVSNGSLSLGSGVNGFGKPRRREVPGAEAATDEPSPSATTEGDDNLSKAAQKNKKKREAKKAKEAADKAAGLTPASDGAAASTVAPSPSRSPERRDRRGHERTRSRADSELRPRSQPRRGTSSRRDGTPRIFGNAPNGTHINTKSSRAPPPAAPEMTVTSPGGGTPQEKKIRALTKKLRAIDDLKMRRAGGETLEGTQIKKMETEESVRRELQGLGWRED